MKFDIITIFPNMFDSYFDESILGRAQKEGIVSIQTHDLRDWTFDTHRTVDDTPYGGGPGMVMKVEPIYKALKDLDALKGEKKTRTILLSARGTPFTQKKAEELSKLDRVTLICGRYEGVDERVGEHLVDEEISIGPYVLTGGEVPAMVVVDSVSRLISGVLGNIESKEDESFSSEKLSVEYPQYTRPEVFSVDGKELKVPEILLSGDHKKIKEWQEKNRK